MISKSKIIKYGGGCLDFDVIDSTSSNIDDLKNAEGLKTPYALIARTLSAGKGQRGRSFVCPLDKGLYFSIALDVNKIDKPHLVTPAVAVIIAQAIERVYSKSVGIKWVNDLFYNSKKVAGILCEAITNADGKIERLIAGVGINVLYSPGLPSVAGSLFSKDEKADVNILAAEVLKGFNDFDFSADCIAEYKSRSIILGREIALERGGKQTRAVARDIDGDGALIVFSEGKEERIIAGEVKIII